MTRQTELFAGLSERDAADLVALAEPISLDAGDVLFGLGDEAANLYLIEDGIIVLTMPMQVGGREEAVRIDERSAGQTLGWSSLIAPHRFTLNASAPVASRLLAFPRSKLVEHFEARPVVGYAVLRNVASIVGQRLQVFQAMWLREMQHLVNITHV